MKQLDWKLFTIGVLLTTTVIIGLIIWLILNFLSSPEQAAPTQDELDSLSGSIEFIEEPELVEEAPAID